MQKMGGWVKRDMDGTPPSYIALDLLRFNDLGHAFFTRNGGKSEGCFSSLNCHPESGDISERVEQNLHLVAEHFASGAKIQLLQQVHGGDVFYLEDREAESRTIWPLPAADAIVTRAKRVILAVLTADCVPILLYNSKEKMIAAVHAGWRGAYDGIVSRTVDVMCHQGCDAGDIVAAIGPCIQQASYKVDGAFVQKWRDKEQRTAERALQWFREIDGAMFFDLPGYCAEQLRGAGVGSVTQISRDTYQNPDEFFSYRRTCTDAANDGKSINSVLSFGRQLSGIMLR